MPHQLVDLCPSTTIREITAPTRPGWTAFNPSIACSPQEYACIVRSSNYGMDCLGRYVTNDPDGCIRTVNYFCPMDDTLNILDMIPILGDPVDDQCAWPLVQGMEDARLYWSTRDDCWHVYGTVRYHQESGVCQIADNAIFSTPAHDVGATRVIYPGPDAYRHEKNWSILPTGKRFVYQFNPLEVYDTNYQEIPARPVDVVYDPELGDQRGSSQVIELTGHRGKLSVTHSVYFPNNSFAHRAYEHRFLQIGGRGPRVERYSPPFYLHGEGIEFVAGIVEWRDSFVLSFGYKDRRALLAIVDKSEVLALLA